MIRQYIGFAIFIALVIVSVVVCAVMYDARIPQQTVVDPPQPTNIHTYTIKCTHNDEYYCSEYRVYKVIKD